MKFRIWNKQLKRFVSEDEWFINGKGEVFFHDIMDYELVNTDSNNVVVQRFTEMVDKNGKEIYEGDILNILNHDQPEEVLYISDGNTAFGFFKHEDYEKTTGRFECLGDYTGPDGYEIIGNIFEK